LAPQHFLAWVERQAQNMRRYLQLSSTAILDPFALAQAMKVKILSPLEIPGIPEPIKCQLLAEDTQSWSAGCLRLPNGFVIIVYNPNHAPTRQRATIMEELADVHLRHKGSQLVNQGNGSAFRSYKKAEETEAYWVGAAALLPRTVLQNAKDNTIPRQILAKQRGVSVDLVIFRERLTKIKLV